MKGIQLADTMTLGSFDWRWPANVESFDHGWDYKAGIDGRLYRVRHGVGARTVFGGHRVHTVTWLDGQPTVEGVAADDYATSGLLLSLLKVGGRAHVRRLADVPRGYEAFDVVRHHDEIVAKYSPRSLCVRLREDDLEGWAIHAVLRHRDKSR